ncbi:hypothetical protein [Dokdonella sp.]|nr:hypothetical protein [Dokdonella sp.]HOX71936.1 hypothetical protein [Dokdonella sp.]HPN80040.1 hypothetical protein [Dokdonella sp.]
MAADAAAWRTSRKPIAEIVGQHRSACVALRWKRHERFVEDVTEIAVPRHLTIRCGKHELPQHCAKLIDIRGGGDITPLALLGGGVGGGHRRQRPRLLSRLRVKQTRNSKVQQAWPSVRIDQEVCWLQVPVYHQIAMRKCHRFANGHEQAHARGNIQLASLAPDINPLPIDVLHGKPWAAIGSDTAIDQMRDVRVRESRENLSLSKETARKFRRKRTLAHTLYRHLLLEATLDTRCQPYFTHASQPQFAHGAKGTELGRQRGWLRRTEQVRFVSVLQQRTQVGLEGVIVCRQSRYLRFALRQVQIDHTMKGLAHAGKTFACIGGLRIHACTYVVRGQTRHQASMRLRSQARANAQSR